MFANFTEELCTGTGITLALSGALAGKIQFQKSYADGDLVAYVLEDSGGTIKIAGVGTYVSATDDITRNDTWNWNGTVIDNNPSTNITLSSGNHTVRCDVTHTDLVNGISVGTIVSDGDINGGIPDNFRGGTFAETTTLAGLTLVPIYFAVKRLITSIGFRVVTGDAGDTNTRVGIYSIDAEGKPKNVLIDSGAIGVTTAGLKYATLSSPILIPAGVYFSAILTESSVVTFGGVLRDYNTLGFAGSDAYSNRNGSFQVASVTGVLPDEPATIVSNTNNHHIIRTK